MLMYEKLGKENVMIVRQIVRCPMTDVQCCPQSADRSPRSSQPSSPHPLILFARQGFSVSLQY